MVVARCRRVMDSALQRHLDADRGCQMRIFRQCHPLTNVNARTGRNGHYFDAQMTCGALSRICRSKSKSPDVRRSGGLGTGHAAGHGRIGGSATYVHSRGVPSPAGSRWLSGLRKATFTGNRRCRIALGLWLRFRGFGGAGQARRNKWAELRMLGRHV
jgi:hypothetical protein